jgi:hypothetical protein
VRSNSREDDHSDLSACYILLVLKTPIHREYDFKTGGFGSLQKLTVLQAAKTGEARGLNLMPGQIVSQSMICTLVEEDPHSGFGG